MSALEKHAQTMHHNQQVRAHVTTGKGPAINTEDVCQLAEAMWSKFGPAQLIPPASKIPTARFSQLVSQLGTLNMVSKLADKLQVNLQTSLPRSMQGGNAKQQKQIHHAEGQVILTVWTVRCVCASYMLHHMSPSIIFIVGTDMPSCTDDTLRNLVASVSFVIRSKVATPYGTL